MSSTPYTPRARSVSPSPLSRSRTGSFLSRRRSLFEETAEGNVEDILNETVEILTNAERTASELSLQSPAPGSEDVMRPERGLVSRRRSRFEDDEC